MQQHQHSLCWILKGNLACWKCLQSEGLLIFLPVPRAASIGQFRSQPAKYPVQVCIAPVGWSGPGRRTGHGVCHHHWSLPFSGLICPNNNQVSGTPVDILSLQPPPMLTYLLSLLLALALVGWWRTSCWLSLLVHCHNGISRTFAIACTCGVCALLVGMEDRD